MVMLNMGKGSSKTGLLHVWVPGGLQAKSTPSADAATAA